MDKSHPTNSTADRPVRVRFAPSPTGNLHIGGARTAIYNWAFARRHQGCFILRIEDTDPTRSTPEKTEQIMRSLHWLGLDWDEGPEVGGNFGPYLQTERFGLYTQALLQLKELGQVYPCFCSGDDLAARREAAMATNSFNGYDRCCRDISPNEAAERIAAGQPHTWRLKLPLEHPPVSFDDRVFGTVTVPFEQMDDFILVRSDGSPTYNFAAVVDDSQMQISHVIRGCDHLSNTSKQILVYEAMGEPVPQFAHISMTVGSDGARLSKRHGATSVEAYRDAGYLPQAMLNYLTLLGWSKDGQTTLFTAEELCESFSLERISRNPAQYDAAKLDWVNAYYIKQMGAKAFIDALAPWLTAGGLARGNLGAAPETVAASIAANRDWYEGIYPLIAERIKKLEDAPAMINYLFSGPTVELDAQSVDKCLAEPHALQVLTEVVLILQNPDLAWDAPSLEAALRTLPEKLGLKAKHVFQAVRVAICGNMVTPPLFESLELIGREDCLARLAAGCRLAGADRCGGDN